MVVVELQAMGLQRISHDERLTLSPSREQWLTDCGIPNSESGALLELCN